MMRILDSPSALQRMKSRNGLNVSTNVNISAYIITTKIKRILNNEFTQDDFSRFLSRQNYVNNSGVSRHDKINQWINRIDKLPVAAVRELYDCYIDYGMTRLVDTLSKPLRVLMKLGVTKKNHD